MHDPTEEGRHLGAGFMSQNGHRHCAFKRRNARIFLYVVNIFEDEIHEVSALQWVTITMQTGSGQLFGPLSVKYHKGS